MPRDYEVYLADIIGAIDRIDRHLRRAKGDFTRDELILDAVVRNLEVIGEAAKGVPEAVRRTRPAVPWRAISGRGSGASASGGRRANSMFFADAFRALGNAEIRCLVVGGVAVVLHSPANVKVG